MPCMPRLTPGSWCPTLLWVLDGTGLTTLLRLVSSAWYTICDQTMISCHRKIPNIIKYLIFLNIIKKVPFVNDANFENYPGACN